jgi:demethylmenaquinone methyltransferase/2-methoxy-6-polyprenyl-1,4-benzoquinol methylase
VVAVDFCPAMVGVAKQRLRATHLQRRVEFKIENVEILPFPDAFFDGVFIAFGMRFVSDIRTVLRECHRVLKPNAPLVILEIAKPRNPLQPLVHLYREYFTPSWVNMRHHIPGTIVHYLHDSLVHYPDADKLGRMLLRASFDKVEYRSLSFGIATLHRGFKTEEKSQHPPLFLPAENEPEMESEYEPETDPESTLTE